AGLVRLEDEETAQDADLRRREAHALRVVHQAGHPVDEAPEIVVEIDDLVRDEAQRRIAVLADLSERQLPPGFGLDIDLDVLVVLVLVFVFVFVLGHGRCSVVMALREPGEDPRNVERLARVRPAADLDVVARLRIHAQPRLGRIPAVVALDQVVDVGEVPPLDEPAPGSRVAAVLLVGHGQPGEVLLREALDLVQTPHVRERPRERREIAVRLLAEVPQPAAQRLPDQRVQILVGLDPPALLLGGRRHVADTPLADDLLRAATLHAVITPIADRRRRRPTTPPAASRAPRPRGAGPPARRSDAVGRPSPRVAPGACRAAAGAAPGREARRPGRRPSAPRARARPAPGPDR